MALQCLGRGGGVEMRATFGFGDYCINNAEGKEILGSEFQDF